MKHLLKLLLLAAVAFPLGMTAQETEVIPGKEVPKLKLQGSSNLEIMNPVTPQTDGVKLDPSAIKPKHAPSKAGQVYDYYSNIVVNGNRTNENVPFRGDAMGRDRSEGQMIYRTSQMGLQNGDIIIGVAFYATSAVQAIDGTTSNLTIRVGETSSTSFGTSNIYTQMENNRASLTEVYTGPIPTGYQLVEFDFDQPYTYNGSNFIIDIQRNSGDFAPAITWSCEQQSNSYYSSAYSYRGANNNANTDITRYLPTMIVYYKRPHQGTVEERTIVVKDEAFFAGKEYKWPYNAEPQNQQTSTLDEIATDPDQMIAMMRTIYMDQTIPGNKKRGFATDGSNTGETNQAVYYSGVGGVNLTGNYVDVTDSYEYEDIYGWGIPGNVNNVARSGNVATATSGNVFNTTTTNTYAYYASLDQHQYEPNEEGLTLLLVELKEDYVDGSNRVIAADETSYATEYDRLRAYFQNTVKSVRIITGAKRTGTGLEAGTLFKIDCDKMNKFFLLAKGQLHLDHNSSTLVPALANAGYISGTIQNNNIDFCVPPGFMFFMSTSSSTWGGSSTSNIGGLFWDNNTAPLFYHMFEQFSPTVASATAGADDLYQDLVNMESFPVIHDCLGITEMNHQFLMYGPDSQDADCQDVRDLMFFIPDYRMLYHGSRGSSTQEYLNYHRDIQPNMGLYVIHQNEITPTTEADDYYMLNLNWVTNLDDFLPSEDQEFELLQIVVDPETGEESYVSVYYMNENGEYTDAEGNVVSEENKVPIVLHLGPGAEKNYPDVYVERLQHGQQVTYAIRGRDAGNFLSLQISNRQSYLIPGKDPAELVMIEDATHYSRYNPQNQKNCYSNRIKISNNALGVTADQITSAAANRTTFSFTRKTSANDPNPVEFARAELTKKSSGLNGNELTITMFNQADKTEFPTGKADEIVQYYAGYHHNPPTSSTESNSWVHEFPFKEVNGVKYVDFNNLIFYDNFTADVSQNQHPNQYIYEVSFNVNPSAPINLGNGQTTTTGHGNTFRVPIYKTASQINGSFTFAEVDAETEDIPTLGVDENIKFNVDAMLSSKQEILRYDTYRWNEGETPYIVNNVYGEDNEQDLPPTGLAGNQGDYYTISMNPGTDYHTTGDASVADGEGTLTFVDEIPTNSSEAGAYIYAPVIETFAYGDDVNGDDRRDYNTYGGPLQSAAVGKFNTYVDTDEIIKDESGAVMYQGISQSTYTWEEGNNEYCYYTVFLKYDQARVPSNDYELYKVRVWRQAPTAMLGEKTDLDEGDLDCHGRVGTEIGEGISSYLFEDITYGDAGTDVFGDEIPFFIGSDNFGDHSGLVDYIVGSKVIGQSGNSDVLSGTFGAKVLEEGDELPLTFIVRSYFTKRANLTNGSKAGTIVEDKVYIVEQQLEYTVTSNNVITAVKDVTAGKQVSGVLYYDMAGQVVRNPQGGIFIKVTRYSDGTTSATKVLK